METHVEFRSDLFPPCQEEEESMYPAQHGEKLAEFLHLGLSRQGFEAGEPFAEDWGWVVPIAGQSFPLWIGCNAYYEYPDGFLCFIEPHTPTIRKLFFWKIDVSQRVLALRDAIDSLLSAESGIRGIRWWTYEAFNYPGRTLQR